MHHQHTPEVKEHADSWHHHEKSEGLPQREHASVIDTGLMFRWFAAISIMLVSLIIAICVYFTSTVTQLKAQLEETPNFAREGNRRREEAMAALGAGGAPFQYAWADAAEGKVRIPIDAAMDKTIQAYGKRGPATR